MLVKSRNCFLLMTALIAVVYFESAAARNASPTTEWEAWIREMAMPPRMPPTFVQQIFEAFTPIQWRMARVFHLLQRLDGNCDDLAFDNMAMDIAAANAVTGGQIWFGASALNESHTHHDQYLALIGEIDKAYEQHGEKICKVPRDRLSLCFGSCFEQKNTPTTRRSSGVPGTFVSGLESSGEALPWMTV